MGDLARRREDAIVLDNVLVRAVVTDDVIRRV
jgi:hypothetical protein